MKMVINGETIVDAIIPNGQNIPKSFRDTGAVITCAPQEAERDDAKYEGIHLIINRSKKLEKMSIPAKAP